MGSRRQAYLGPPLVQRWSREHLLGSFRTSAQGPRKPSANGRSSSLIIEGLDSTMQALGHNSRLAGSTKSRLARSTERSTEAVPRLALAARRAELAKCRARGWPICNVAGVARSDYVWLLRLGAAALQSCVATGGGQDQQTWPLVSGVLDRTA